MDVPLTNDDRDHRIFLVSFLQGLSARIEDMEWSHALDSLQADIDAVVKSERAQLYPESKEDKP